MQFNFIRKNPIGRWLAFIRLTVFALLLSTYAFGQVGSNDNSFMSYTSGFNPSFTQLEALPSGKILAVGGPKGLTRLNADGSVDNTFNEIGTGGTMSTILVLGNGQILANNISQYNGIARGGFARINADGTLDTSFNPVDALGNPFSPNSFAVQSTGKIIVSVGPDLFNIFRINADGSYDTTFKVGTAGSSSSETIKTILVRPSTDKIILVGNGASGDGLYTIGANTPIVFNGVIQLLADGTHDATFAQLPNASAIYVRPSSVLQPDGKILIPLQNPITVGSATYLLLRINTNGSIDNTLNNGTGFASTNPAILNPFISDLYLQPDGDVIITGGFESYRGTARNGIARINSDGSIDTGFVPGTGFPEGEGPVTITRLASDGSYVASGLFLNYNGAYRNALVRINATGGNDAAFINYGYGFDVAGAVNTVLVRADKKIVVGGGFTTLNGADARGIVRLNEDGTKDNTFSLGSGFNQSVRAIVQQPDSKLWVGGDFINYNTTNLRNGIVRLKEDGGYDVLAGEGVGLGEVVYTLALRPSDGEIFVGGSFTTYNTAPVKPVILLNKNTGQRINTFSLPSSFQDGATVTSIAVQSAAAGGRVVIGGSNMSFDGIDYPNIFMLNANGTRYTTFNVGTGFNFGAVNTIAILPSGNILVGGAFSEYKGAAVSNLVLLDAANGNLLPAFSTGVVESVNSISVQSDGKILVAAGVKLRRYNPDGTIDTSFATEAEVMGFSINAIAVQPSDNKIIIGGSFSKYQGAFRDNLARVNVVESCPTITINPANLAAATVGTAYSQAITATGGIGTTTFAVTIGTLPTGLTLAGSGSLTGTPTAAGSSSFTITATANGCTGAKSYTITTSPAPCPTINLSPATLPNGVVGTAYNTSITATGGTGTTTFAVTTGTLPAGLTLSNSGSLTGTPTTAGSSSFTITATANGCTGTKSYTITTSPAACPTINLSPATLPNGVVGTAYSTSITATGGVGTTTFAVTTGTLPAGLTLSNSGSLTGTPTTAGSSSFTITATANGCTGTKSYTITTSPAACPTINLSPASLPDGVVGTAYSTSITATGGVGTTTFAVTTGTLPAGLTLSNSGSLTGTPTAAGSSSFTITATANGCTGTKSYTITTSPAACSTINLSPASLPVGVVGTAYSTSISATGGANNFSINDGTLPPGLTLTSVGLLSGTPTIAGSSVFTIQASVSGCSGAKSYTLIIDPAPCSQLILFPEALSEAVKNQFYEQSLSATGGSDPYTFVIKTGSLPSGLSLANGVITGQPTVVGTSTLTMEATDAVGCKGTKEYTITVNDFVCPALSINSSTVAQAKVGDIYSASLSVTGGQAPYLFSIASGTMPSGLELTDSGNISGTPTESGNFLITIKATDVNSCFTTKQVTIIVKFNCNLTSIVVSPATLPSVASKDMYNQTLTASGSSSPYTFLVSTGALPAGLTLNQSTGVITGSSSVEGRSSFEVIVTDGNGCTTSKQYSVCINPKPTVTPSLQNNYAQFVLLSSSAMGNQWFKDEEIIQDATGPQYNVTSIGSYRVQVTVNSCFGKSAPYLIDVTTAVEPGLSASGQLKLFPNPAVNKIRVEYPGSSTNVKFSIVNLLGASVYSGELIRNAQDSVSAEIDISLLPAGSYILKMDGDKNQNAVKRFIKY